MPITVSMIEEKEFKTKMRGYDPVEVDEFLDEICDEMVALQEEIATLNQRLSQASHVGAYAPAAVPVPAPAPAPAPIPVPAPAPAAAKPVVEPVSQKQTEEASEAAQKLLARAQKLYDETIAEAKAEAKEILDGANSRASQDIDALEEEKNALQQEVDMLKAAAKDYRERFQRLIDDQMHILKAENGLFE